ncbi:unnamed protein product [Brassica oleracea]|uniref:(rape) hypothetical protein n=2 Tax=Brassica napus TaxID=3708 RepID=A0A816M6R3_BRANA|nr:unnamed protein product [Brassica napus]
MGFTEIKAPPVHTTLQNVLAGGVFPVEASGDRSTVNLQPESCGKDLEAVHQMLNHPCLRNQWTKRKQDESPRISDENSNKAGSKNSETEPSSKRGASAAPMKKSIKQDCLEDDGKSGKAVGTSTPDKGVIYLERRQAFLTLTKASPGISANGSLATGSSKVLVLSTNSLDVHTV